MKDSLFDVLKDLLVNSISKHIDTTLENTQLNDDEASDENLDLGFVALPSDNANRVFTIDESMKLTLGCRSLLTFAEKVGLLSPMTRELVIDELMAMDASVVNKDEAKWVIIKHSEKNLTDEQLAFLDYALTRNEHTAN